MIPYPRSYRPVSGCSECDAQRDDYTLRCSWRHCDRLYCESCAVHCHGCSDIVCPEHTEVWDGEPHCRTCADISRQHAEELFDLVRAAYARNGACPECDGVLEDHGDPFGDRDEEEVYGCLRCGMEVIKRRKATPELRMAQAMRYVSDQYPMPPAEYTFTEGKITAASSACRKKPAVVALENKAEVSA